MYKKQNILKPAQLILLGCLSLLVNLGCGKKVKENELETASATKEESLSSSGSLSTRTEIYSPEKQLAGFKVPEGFIIELVASEKDGIINPIDLTFDDAGRLWTQTAKMYPLDPIVDQYVNRNGILAMEDAQKQKEDANFKRILDLYQGNTKGDDKILVLSNLYTDKKLKVNTWADGLAIPQSIMPYKDGVFVAQGSEMFILNDTDNDGKADKRTPLLTGFGYTDTHTMSHTLVRAPGDWIHFSHGALNKGVVTSLTGDGKVLMNYSKTARFSLDGKKIELVNSGLNNIWGFQLRADGAWYGCEANDLGYSIVPMEPGTGYPGIGGDKLRPYQPMMDKVHEFRVGGSGISGLAFAEDSKGSFPKEWKDVALLANPITSTINAVRIVRNSDGSVTAEHLPDLLTSEDDWFRPVNMEFGPDGSLYIADWYNKIVSHNEVATSDPSRDKSHGRIWRIRHESQKPRKVPNMYNVNTNELPRHLESTSIWEKRAAWHQISDRPIEETRVLAKDLIALASDSSKDEVTRILALWSLEGIRHFDALLMEKLVLTAEGALKREAVRSLVSFSLNPEQIAKLLAPISQNKNAMLRAQVLRTLEEMGSANSKTIEILVDACKPPLEGNALGGAYERNFERYLARKALESYQNQLWNFIKSTKVANYDASNIIWASQALPKNQREEVFLNFWKKADYKKFDDATFIVVASMLDNEDIYNAVRPILEEKDNSEHHVSIALENLSQVQSRELAKVLTKPIQQLLQSNEKGGQILGLKAVGNLGISSLRAEVIPFIENKPSPEILRLVMAALKDEPVVNVDVFAKLSKNNTLDLPDKATALQIYAKADFENAYAILESWLPKLNGVDRKSVTEILTNTSEGITLSKQLYNNEKISSEAFTIFGAEKIGAADVKDPIGQTILAKVQERLAMEKKNYAEKFERFLAIAEKKDGNPEKGEQYFQVCLMCHKVGNKGQEYAPTLDGSASRENVALLTAILDPDAAMEGSYAIYRITKKDGSTLEGFLVNKDDNGTTIGFMGGSQQYVPIEEIDKQQFQKGRSFMPKGLIDSYSDQQVSDLLAYIENLN